MIASYMITRSADHGFRSHHEFIQGVGGMKKMTLTLASMALMASVSGCELSGKTTVPDTPRPLSDQERAATVVMKYLGEQAVTYKDPANLTKFTSLMGTKAAADAKRQDGAFDQNILRNHVTCTVKNVSVKYVGHPVTGQFVFRGREDLFGNSDLIQITGSVHVDQYYTLSNIGGQWRIIGYEPTPPTKK